MRGLGENSNVIIPRINDPDFECLVELDGIKLVKKLKLTKTEQIVGFTCLVLWARMKK